MLILIFPLASHTITGNVQGFQDFQEYWCVDHYGTYETCVGAAGATNKDWQENFVLWGATLITFGMRFSLPPKKDGALRAICSRAGMSFHYLGCVRASRRGCFVLRPFRVRVAARFSCAWVGMELSS